MQLDLSSQYVPITAFALVLLGAVVFLVRRKRQETRDEFALARAVAEEVHLPASLHPVIDPDICIGSLSCIKACPEGDILGVVDGVAKLIVGANCIGHGRCALECPVHAIRLVVGTSERGVDLPEIDTNFMSSRAGVYVVGELGGMGLIKNAITQGLQCARHLGDSGAGKGGEVLIVGAGPAGLATALGLRAAKVPFRIVDQGVFGGTIASYPRQKVVMTERVELPLVGKFGKPTISKEDLLETWGRIAKKAQIRVEEMIKVEGIDGGDGAFRVRTSRGEIRASKVVLATGRRGSPRKLGCEGEDLPKVTYQLDDPEQYRGRRVLVVGGGDSAIEAACSLAEVGDVAVAISYRQKAFAKCRQANRERIGALIAARKVQAFLGSAIKRVNEDSVHLGLDDGRVGKLPNDYVIACLGGELPAAFLKGVGVGMRRHTGDISVDLPAMGPSPHRRKQKAAHGAKQPRKPGRRDYLVPALLLVGTAVLGALSMMGWEYYVLDFGARKRDGMHALLRPSGLIGHGIGVVATLFMMSNFLYPLRKRLGFLKGTAPIKSWLTFHVFVGIMSPLVIAFHAAFQSRNQLASATYASLLVVVLTGIVGRFIFGLVPSGKASNEELDLVRGQLAYEQSKVHELIETSHAGERLRRLFERAAAEPEKGGSLVLHLLGSPTRWLADRLRLLPVRGVFESREAYLDFRHAYLEMRRLHTQASFYRKLKRLLSVWRVFHVVLSIFLVGVIAIHVGFSLYLGYKWVL